LTEEYLQSKFPLKSNDVNYLVNSRILPTEEFIDEIQRLTPGEKLIGNGEILAACLTKDALPGSLSKISNNNKNNRLNFLNYKELSPKRCKYNYELIENIRSIFLKNRDALIQDFSLLTNDRKSQKISKTNTVIGDEDMIFIEKGAKVEASIFNTTSGPIYIGKDAEIMEGSIIRGPFAMNEHAVLKLGAKIYGPTTLGPYCKVGGEVNNVVFQGYSNKGHDGFLGNSVIGEWCNLGADTNSSNLKNNYSEVKVWDYEKESLTLSGLQFCGLIMGDHSKCGINTMFNTGTTVGVSANIFGGDFPPKFIPSFTWGGAKGFTEFRFEKALEVAQAVMKRRDIELSNNEKAILQHIFNITQKYRH
ncbi:MAG TPA: glucose-1-phosphate thymidylyltransferase, partial [Flavobacteriales bacterium]|nr:glucose-1-phosphate thymidylyltransferase [Flavobacteriales bacterium]